MRLSHPSPIQAIEAKPDEALAASTRAIVEMLFKKVPAFGGNLPLRRVVEDISDHLHRLSARDTARKAFYAGYPLATMQALAQALNSPLVEVRISGGREFAAVEIVRLQGDVIILLSNGYMYRISLEDFERRTIDTGKITCDNG